MSQKERLGRILLLVADTASKSATYTTRGDTGMICMFNVSPAFRFLSKKTDNLGIKTQFPIFASSVIHMLTLGRIYQTD